MKPNLPRNEESEESGREKMEKLPSISIERENEGRGGEGGVNVYSSGEGIC